MNTVKNFTTIHLQLNWIDVPEVVILLINYLKTEDLNLSVSNMITAINESKTLAKHVSCKCKCEFDAKKLLFKLTVE